MSYAAINAMVNTLGDTGHSHFIDPQAVQIQNQVLSGQFVGIGIYLHQNPKTQQWVITAPIPDSPAEKVGIRPGDTILTFNGSDITGKDICN